MTLIKLSEHEEQVAVVQWLRMVHPEVLFWATPNGGYYHGTPGQRIGQSRKLVAEGMLPGCCDLVIAVARGGYHAAAVEMKSLTGRLSTEQMQFIGNIRECNWYPIVGYGFENARDKLEIYFGMDDITFVTP